MQLASSNTYILQIYQFPYHLRVFLYLYIIYAGALSRSAPVSYLPIINYQIGHFFFFFFTMSQHLFLLFPNILQYKRKYCHFRYYPAFIIEREMYIGRPKEAVKSENFSGQRFSQQHINQ